MDVRIVAGDQNTPGGVVNATVENSKKRRPLHVTLVNASGDIYNASGGSSGSGGDGAILDGANSSIKASVKSTAVANPLHVIITNISGDTPNLAAPGGSGGPLVDGSDANLKATVKDYANSNPLAVVLVNASGDSYNANSVSVAVNKWNLVPTQDAVHVNSGLIGVTGDVSTIPKAGSTWPVNFSGTIGVQIIGSNVGSASGDSYVNQRGAWATAVTGDVSTTPKAGSTWPVREQGVVGVQVIGGVTSLVSISGDQLNVQTINRGTGDTSIVDGATPSIKATVKDFSNAKPLAVTLVNASGDVYNAGGGASSGGDGAILDGVSSSIKATVKQYSNSNPLTVVLVNASGDAYNGNQTSVTLSKWNLTPTQDSVHVNSGLVGVTGDVSTVPKAGQTWPVREQGVVGVQIVGSAVGSVSGDTYVNQRGAWAVSVTGDVLLRQNPGTNIGNVSQQGGWSTAVTGDVSTTPKAGSTWPVREQGVVGVQVVGGSIGAQISASGDLYVAQRGAWATAVTGDVSTIPKTGSTWPVSFSGPVGVQIVGGGVNRVSISGDTLAVTISQTLNVSEQNKTGVHVASGLTGVTGDVSTVPKAGSTWPVSLNGTVLPTGDFRLLDGSDASIKVTVKNYTNAKPVAVALVNASGDVYNAANKIHVLITVAGRVTSAGSNSIVSAVTGKKIKVTSYELQGDGDNARGYFASGASGSQLNVEWELAALDGVVKDVPAANGSYLFATAAGAALSFESSSSRTMKYAVTYHAEDAV